MYLCVDVALASAWTGGRILIHSFMHPSLVLYGSECSSLKKMEALQTDTETQNGGLVGDCCNYSGNILGNYVDHIPTEQQ